MFINQIRKSIFIVCFMPVAAFGTMEYVPSQPCSYDDMNDGELYHDTVNSKYSFVRTGYITNGTDNVDVSNNQQHEMVNSKYNFVRTDYSATDTDSIGVGNTRHYDFQKKSKINNNAVIGKNFYLSGNIGMNLWSWENEYESDYSFAALVFDKDEYSFESVFGGSLAIGMIFDSNLRGDLELGFSSEFSDSDDMAKFTMHVPYLMINVYHDFDSGMYFGGGLGIAKPSIKIEGTLFEGNGSENSSLSPKAGVALGYSTEIGNNVYVDARYRLSLLKGTDVSASFLWTENSVTGRYVLQVENDLILENALSLGLRIHF